MSAELPTPVDPAACFEQRRTVVPADIDANGHVNNLRYLAWILDAAIGHSEAVGWTLARYQELGATWIVRSHTIEYLRPAFAGDEVVVRTWVSQISKVSSRRKSQVLRPDGVVLARAETLWVFVSRRAHALGRVPPELAAAFPIVPDRRAGPLMHRPIVPDAAPTRQGAARSWAARPLAIGSPPML